MAITTEREASELLCRPFGHGLLIYDFWINQ